MIIVKRSDEDQKHKKAPKNANFHDKTQHANFRGKALFQVIKTARKQQLNGEKK